MSRSASRSKLMILFFWLGSGEDSGVLGISYSRSLNGVSIVFSTLSDPFLEDVDRVVRYRGLPLERHRVPERGLGSELHDQEARIGVQGDDRRTVLAPFHQIFVAVHVELARVHLVLRVTGEAVCSEDRDDILLE